MESWHFLMVTRKEKLFLASIWSSWTPRFLSRTLHVLQGSNARDATKREGVPGIHKGILNSKTPLRNNFCSLMFQWLWWLKGRLWWAGRVQPPGGHASNWKPRKKWPLGLLFSIVQYKTGGEGEQGHVKFTDILEWEPILRKWKRLGSLKQGRYLHICHH